ncbi:MAG: hypothetical protein HYU64_17090 [Armatimonadetes bacterium]|nr:hypothetical protein [Armatimonadota bacterium]
MSAINPGLFLSQGLQFNSDLLPRNVLARDDSDVSGIGTTADTADIQSDLTVEQADEQMKRYLSSLPPERKRFFKQLFQEAKKRSEENGTPLAVEMSQAILSSPQTSAAEKQLATDFIKANNKKFGTSYPADAQGVQAGQGLTPQNKTLEEADQEMLSYLQALPPERKAVLRPIFQQAAAQAKANKTPLAAEIARAILLSGETNEQEKQLAVNFLEANQTRFHGGGQTASPAIGGRKAA